MVKRLCAALAAFLVIVAVVFAGASTVFANDPYSNQTYNPCAEAKGSALCTSKTNSTNNPLTGPNGTIRKITVLVARIAGIAAVIIIMVAGFMYITSGGDPGKAGEAKKAILYAVIGLIVIVVAQSLILFILSKVT